MEVAGTEDDIDWKNTSIAETEDLEENFTCPICTALFDVPVTLKSCQHIFCSRCIREWLSKKDSESSCPICRVHCENDELIPNKAIMDAVDVWIKIRRKVAEKFKIGEQQSTTPTSSLETYSAAPKESPRKKKSKSNGVRTDIKDEVCHMLTVQELKNKCIAFNFPPESTNKLSKEELEFRHERFLLYYRRELDRFVDKDDVNIDEEAIVREVLNDEVFRRREKNSSNPANIASYFSNSSSVNNNASTTSSAAATRERFAKLSNEAASRLVIQKSGGMQANKKLLSSTHQCDKWRFIQSAQCHGNVFCYNETKKVGFFLPLAQVPSTCLVDNKQLLSLLPSSNTTSKSTSKFLIRKKFCNGKPWYCKACTLKNEGNSTKCAVCQTVKPSTAEITVKKKKKMKLVTLSNRPPKKLKGCPEPEVIHI